MHVNSGAASGRATNGLLGFRGSEQTLLVPNVAVRIGKHRVAALQIIWPFRKALLEMLLLKRGVSAKTALNLGGNLSS